MVSNIKEEWRPGKWFQDIERSREKASKHFQNVVAVNMKNSILVGKLTDISYDKLGERSYPFCKLTLSKAKKFSLSGKLKDLADDVQLCFVNNPDMIMEISELQEKFPAIHEEVHVLIKREFFG